MKLEITQLEKAYNKQKVLKNINLSIPEAQSLALLGPSGSGKSTLLRILAGLESPTCGRVNFDGVPLIFEEKQLRQHRLKLGILFQSWNLFPHLTALENISLPLYRVHGYSKEDADSQAMTLLNRFELAKHAHKKPAELSGGQCQRVAIIRAIAIQPSMLLFDEPTSALDPLMTSEVLDLIVELKKEGKQFIIVTHHISFARKICDWILFLSEGKVLDSKPTSQFFDHPASPEIQYYLEQVLKY
ncbi:glutamate transport ATP-binding protein GluA [Parachlamydia acanthamoebae UV-7]|uniref:Glutamate transport ATP-binding protein GluA n=2 Tax=Parachlamydia acanthamoebae TaxID=83552 RepID=F8KXP9_PARAV|nr:amino acid ABC transporter ATP-binding protein [Parachlamydia acanthamoebae]KIA76670.1 Glutamate transport ATP-binding protein GluA [Parachlamydia acanthamoebae]CCB87661.1 glutamate transport ATP-binding protein GluA [Parachlamydia acanthamoebae UV-7]